MAKMDGQHNDFVTFLSLKLPRKVVAQSTEPIISFYDFHLPIT